MIQTTLQKNLAKIIDEIHTLGRTKTDHFYLHIYEQHNQLQYSIDDATAAPYKYQIMDFDTEDIKDLTKTELSLKVAKEIHQGIQKLHRDIELLKTKALEIITRNADAIIDETIDILDNNPTTTYYLNIEIKDDKITTNISTAAESCYAYTIFDSDSRYISKRQLYVQLLDMIPILQREWQFLSYSL